MKNCYSCIPYKAIPLAFDNSLSYLEMICNLINEMNQLMQEVENLSSIVNNIDFNFDEINQKINDLNFKLNNLTITINNEVDSKLTKYYNDTLKLMSDYQKTIESYVNIKINDVQSQIDRIELGDVKAYDPTRGVYDNVSTAILNVYNASRSNAISCSEFDALQLTASEFDAKEITAFNFDINGKTILTA